jgi:hypothetical protein
MSGIPHRVMAPAGASWYARKHTRSNSWSRTLFQYRFAANDRIINRPDLEKHTFLPVKKRKPIRLCRIQQNIRGGVRDAVVKRCIQGWQ